VSQCGTHETGARRIGQFFEHNVLTQLAQIWLQGRQERLLVRSVLLQPEASSPLLSVPPKTPEWAPKPSGGLWLQVSADAEGVEQ
jgi:hypothetical protein